MTGQSWDILLRKLRLLNDLSDADAQAIRSLPIRLQKLQARSVIIRDGETISNCCLLIEGVACRHKLARSGGRQIVSFHNPGDLLDLQHLQFDRADHNIQTITDATLGFIPMRELRTLVDEYPAIRKAFWRDCLIDASVFREWVLNVGRRDAKTRIAHMLCEFVARHKAVGLGSPSRFVLPMTQEDIADAVGLTAVHVNRMLRELTEEGVLIRAGREVRISDWERMKRLADFQPHYLHLAA